MDNSSTKTQKDQKAFEQYINFVVKQIRLKEQNTLDLIQHIQQILANRAHLNLIVFVHDQISKHQVALEKFNLKFKRFKQQEHNLLERYFADTSSKQISEHQTSQMRRICARILQIFQLYNQKAEKYQFFQQEIGLHYKVAKATFLKQIRQLDRSEVTLSLVRNIFKQFFQYSNKKYQDQTRKLSKIIQCIEMSNYDNLIELVRCNHCAKISNEFNAKKNTGTEKSNISKQIRSVNGAVQYISKQSNQQASKMSYNQIRNLSRQRQKQKLTEKLKIMREQSKQKQILKRRRTKFANKYFTIHSSAMQISKNHFMDEFIFTVGQKQHAQKLMNDIISKNKLNEKFISQFREISSQKELPQNGAFFQPLFCQQNKKDYIEQYKYSFTQNTPKSEVLIARNEKETEFQSKDEDPCLQQGRIKVQQGKQTRELDERNQTKSFRITTSNNAKKYTSISPMPSSNPGLFTSKNKEDSFNFIKINMKNPVMNSKSRLPDISNRLMSVESKQKSTKHIGNNMATHNILTVKTGSVKVKQMRTSVSSKIKRSESRNNTLDKKCSKQSSRTLDMQHYSLGISKKLNQFCEMVSNKNSVY